MMRKKSLTAKKTEILVSHSFFHPGGTIVGVLFLSKRLIVTGLSFCLPSR